MTDFHYDTHTIFAETGIATREQIEISFQKAIEELNIPCRFKVNLVETKNGICGYAYIWLTSPQVYHALMGKNLDGTDLVMLIDDPTWNPPKKSLNEALNDARKKENLSSSWADIEDESDIIKSYKCPQIKKNLDPIIKISGYKYNDEQLEFLKLRNKHTQQKDGAIPGYGYFEIGPAYVSELDIKLCHNVLISRKIPEWITVEIFKQLFYNYVSNPITPHRCSHNSKSYDTYPHVNIINIKGNRSVFITFDPTTYDARFALLMVRKLKIVDPEGKNPDSTLIFNHSFNSNNNN